ncbi:MAG: ABC transporter permease subunit [Eubacteriales bacterium]|nr:ABC transporter permease subunit [Eubacteriales bacterium]
MILFRHEVKQNGKSLLIWAVCIGLISFGCLLLFENLADTIGQMAKAYASMGKFSEALGMDRLNISTIEGFYATEIALIHAIGGAMFAAMTGASLLSKEEEGHTAEFLHALPLGRSRIVRQKYTALAALVFLFQIITVLAELAGFAAAGEMPDKNAYAWYHGAQFLMQLEVGSVCFLISAACKRKQIGTALGLALVLYFADMICRILPGTESLKYVTPYYFSNATDIFLAGKMDGILAGIGLAVTAASTAAACFVYKNRDLAA